MNILQINTLVTRGGAARVMSSLHHAFRERGHQSLIAARSVKRQEIDVYSLADLTFPANPAARRVMRAVTWRLDRWLAIASLHPVPRKLSGTALFQNSDIVQLHNLHGYYFDYRYLDALTAQKPVVWTLHDMWAFTGHCAYAYDCLRWKEGCGSCPLLHGEGRRWVEPRPPAIDRTRQVWTSKRKVYARSRIQIVTPSRWLQHLAQESIIGQGREIHHIPNGIDTNVFKPTDRNKARTHFEIPPGKKVLLFSAEKTGNPRKGFSYLKTAIGKLPASEFVLLIMGYFEKTDFPDFHVIATGYLEDPRTQALAYSAADLLIFPSLADNQPLGVLESLACGTPVVAFETGGLPEVIRHMETGYLARYKDTSDLHHGVEALLRNSQRLRNMRSHCRTVAVNEYSLDLQASRYLALYAQLLERRMNESI